MSRAHALLLSLLAAVIFVIAGLIDQYEEFLGVPPSFISLFVLLLAGTGITAFSTYWTEHRVHAKFRREFEEQRRALSKELGRRQKQLCAAHIDTILTQPVDQWEIQGRVRTFVFVMDENSNKLSPAYWQGRRNEPDHGLEYEALRGWVGDVWDKKEQIAYDLEGRSEEEVRQTWKFTHEQYVAIENAGVRSVLYTPIFHPFRSSILLGVFGIDSTRPLSDTRFNEVEVQNKAVLVAETLGMFLHVSSAPS